VSDIASIIAGLPRRISHVPLAWAGRAPHAPALRAADTVLTYGELATAIAAAKDVLLGLGVRPGDRLMIVNENSIGLVALVFAASELDAWAVIVNARMTPREIDVIRDHCRPRRMVYTVSVSPEARAHADRSGAETLHINGIEPLAVSAAIDGDVEPVHAGGDRQVAALIYTSGTTAEPKGVMLTHRNVLYIAAVSGRQRGLVADDHVYGVLPISHVFGLASTFLGTLYAGGCLELVPRFDPAHLAAALARGITVFQGVPAMYARLLEYAEVKGIRLEAPKLRYLSAGGAPLDPGLKFRVEKAFGLILNNGYGLTECAPTVSQTLIDQPRTDDSVGPPLPGLEIRIVGADGGDVRPGDIGELWVRGPNVMAGYYRNGTGTAEVLSTDGWLKTGDLARSGTDGHLFIVGRSKELIIRSGFNVYPAEVEAVLNDHPAVTLSAVVGRCVAGNEEVVAFVQLVPGCTVGEEEIRMFAANRLAPYKVPSRVVRLDEFPAGSTGKVLKRKLFEMAAAMEDDTTMRKASQQT
jgi:acyl-CoA synthetase (AMP-forming)/AMP-acid ligase II